MRVFDATGNTFQSITLGTIFRKLAAELEAARTPPHSSTRLKDFSLLTWVAERIFFWLEFLSPTILFIPTRNLLHYHSQELEEGDSKEAFIIEKTKHRAQRVDAYMMFALVSEVILIALLPYYYENATARILVAIVSVLRIIEIIQANANLNLFDRIRYGESNHVTVSLTRNLLLSGMTYIELMLLFGLLYTMKLSSLAGATGWGDALYFSFITQLTIGYGDIHPVGFARFLSAIQGTIGLFFSLLIMGRFVSLLPSVRTVLGDEEQIKKP